MKKVLFGTMMALSIFVIPVDASPIHDAAIRGDWNAIQQELLNNVDVNLADINGYTALIFATNNAHTDVVKNLLQIPGIDVNHVSKFGHTALMIATGPNHTKIAKVLLQVPGIDVNKASNGGYTALMSAACIGSTKVVKNLLRVPGINVNKTDDDGNTALMYATRQGFIDIIELIENHIIKLAGMKTKSAIKR